MNLRAASIRYWQRFLADRQDPYGWVQFVWLFYLCFLFIPLMETHANYRWLWATLISLPIFLLLFFAYDWAARRSGLWQPISIAVLGLCLIPFNPYGNTYLIFAASFAPFALPGLLRPLLLTFAFLVPYAIETAILDNGPYALGITVIVASMSCMGNYLNAENRRKNAALQMSQEEIRRLAQVAERERIGRDLHDLLGHTLSLIAIKAELAGKLLKRNQRAAASEIEDVQQIAREALKQVRSAVSGIRAVGLQGELSSARAMLESSNVKLSCRYESEALAPEIEIALAMIVREAVTNIHRHAEATQATVEITSDGRAAALVVSDNGKGGIATRGNGLIGVRERTLALGGFFEIDSPAGCGTTLRARFPLVSTESLVSSSI